MANPGESPTALTVNPSILYQAWVASLWLLTATEMLKHFYVREVDLIGI